MTSGAHEHAHATRALFGLREQPGRLALAAMRLPRPLYHRGWGWMLDHTFLLIAHQGRKTGKRRETVAMALAYDPATYETVVCSAWGPNTEWMRNLRAHPALQIEIGANRTCPSSASSPRTRALRSWPSSGAGIHGGSASSRRFSGGVI
jgi:deazaflavin-dependent oxidoreductase (nitroreductase family)